MKRSVSLGLILLMVIPRNALSPPSTAKQSGYSKLNLTEEVQKYTKSYISANIVDFSLKDKTVNGELPSLTARAGKLAYGNGCEKRLYATTNECSDLYMFYIYNGISTPFNLTINITLSYRGRRNDTFLVDINDASYIYWNPDNITMYPADTTNYSEEKCNFTCEVFFHGTFAYEVTEVKNDKPNKGLEGIGRVSYINDRKLVYNGDLDLAYNISGVFLHAMTCNNK
uniref:DA-P36 family member n=1 Tax=Rhipicephalus zambeziensis TaxID=60191 RepID=A0A224YCJ7_9ACAR